MNSEKTDRSNQKHFFPWFQTYCTVEGRFLFQFGNILTKIWHAFRVYTIVPLDANNCMSRVMRKVDFGLCGNKGADQLSAPLFSLHG